MPRRKSTSAGSLSVSTGRPTAAPKAADALHRLLDGVIDRATLAERRRARVARDAWSLTTRAVAAAPLYPSPGSS
eukprot:14533981-Alexandrium_andersonii.AAC.1